MRTVSIAILFILISFSAVKAQQVIYFQSFEDTSSLFHEYVLANYDNGIPAGTGWDTLADVAFYVDTVDVSGNRAAIGTSDYDPAVTANDWLITPGIRLGKASKLEWQTASLSAPKTDMYEVYVSTSEQSTAGCLFNGVAGTFASEASTAFIANSLDLAAAGYANQTVFIGFRLKTATGGGHLAIDNIKVTEDSTRFVSLTFIVDMSVYIEDSLFNPRTDTVDVAGTFNGFDGTKNILALVPGTDSTVYSTTIPGFLDGDHLEFKFRINSSWHDSVAEFPYGAPNRVWDIESGKYTYTCFYNNLGTTFGIPENILMDQVGLFPNPVSDKLYLTLPEKIIRYQLFSVTGSLIASYKVLPGNNNLDVSSLSDGTYLLLFYTQQGYAGSKKLIKN